MNIQSKSENCTLVKHLSYDSNSANKPYDRSMLSREEQNQAYFTKNGKRDKIMEIQKKTWLHLKDDDRINTHKLFTHYT